MIPWNILSVEKIHDLEKTKQRNRHFSATGNNRIWVAVFVPDSVPPLWSPLDCLGHHSIRPKRVHTDLFFFRTSMDSSRPTSCEERTLRTLLSPPSLLSAGSHTTCQEALSGVTPRRSTGSESRRRPQYIVTNAVDSVLCTELVDLEPQEEDVPIIL